MAGRNLGVNCSDRKGRPTSFQSCPIVAILAQDPSGHCFSLAWAEVDPSRRSPCRREPHSLGFPRAIASPRSRRTRCRRMTTGSTPLAASSLRILCLRTPRLAIARPGAQATRAHGTLVAAIEDTAIASERDSDRLPPVTTPSSRRSRSSWSRRSLCRTATPTRMAPSWCSTKLMRG